MVKRTISSLLLLEALIILLNIVSFESFINVQIAALSSFFVVAGSMYAHRKLVENRIEKGEIEDKRDILDEIEDPHELYEEALADDNGEVDIKAVIKEEKKKIRTLNLKELKKGSSAGFSPVRVVPYVFLTVGFIALKNNHLLNISLYLPSLALGIAAAYISFKNIYISKTLP